MKVDLARGAAVVRPAKGKSFDPTKIPRAVKDAGFTPGDIELTATGTLAQEKDLLLLKMAGLLPKLVLAGGAKAAELKQQTELVGKRLRVTGKLHPSHADQPPGLTVEQWAPLDK
ncbi:MAG: hypothetical protein HYY26_04735 [Acidobacteria bacterium]|nr:hypothetical protein [Acidobacteriota bacterium]